MKYRFFSFCIGILTGLQCYILPTRADLPDVRLHESADAGDFYLSRLTFFGESTTSHLTRRGGVLDTPNGRRQVLRDESGTRMLDRRILASPVTLYTENGNARSLPFSEAISELRPDILVLSFGLNGIMEFSKDPQLFSERYTHLICGIREGSPNTKIILQSVYPVRSSGKYTVDVKTLNRYIDHLNTCIARLAAEQTDIRYADTASILKDSDGALKSAYDSGDGIHLTNEAYAAILHYFRTHPWQCA